MSLTRWLGAIGVLALIAICPASATAEQPFAGCLDEFWAGQPPLTVGSGITDALCSAHFATPYSEQTETPLLFGRASDPDQIHAAIHVRRNDEFHEDERLPPSVTSTLEDYRHSGYDRGHMAPNGDMPDAKSQWQSFALSNIVPQNANDNRNLWADIEFAVRELVLAGGDGVYVVTGPIFGPDDPPALRGRVQVPELLFKGHCHINLE